MEPLPICRKHPLVHDLTDPVMGEVQISADGLEKTTPDEAFDEIGDVAFIASGRAGNDVERDGLTRDGGHGEQVTAVLIESGDLGCGQLPHTLGKGRALSSLLKFADGL